MSSPSVSADQLSAAESEAAFPFHDAIAARAHEKWVARGRPPGSYVRDWLEAEADFMEAYFSARKRNERRMVAEHAVTRILAESADALHATPRIVQAICECLGWDLGAIWTLDRQAHVLRCVDVWRTPSVEAPEFEQATRRATYAEGVGLPGRIWASWKPVWIADVSIDANLPRAPIAAREGLHAGCAFPVHNGVEFLGVMEFYSREIQEPDKKLLDMMVSIGHQICQFLERRRAEKQLLDRQLELNLAREIQQRLLPKTMPVVPGFAIGGATQFCQETGGDYYDVFPLSDGSLAIAIADASGHGMAAALVIENTRACLRALALTSADPASIVAITNNRLTEDLDSGHFVTLFLARLDPGRRSLTYSNAGHPSGYVLDQQGKVRSVLHSTGMPLGLDPTAEFPAAPAVTLLPGDLLFLFTDGITEAFSPQDAPFGIERALNVVRGHQHENPEMIVQGLFCAVTAFSDGQAQLDDITAVISKVEATA